MAAEQFGPYRLETLIGCGGMGEVYRAFDIVRNRFVALKRLPPQLKEDAEFRARFQRESQLVAQLRHPHVIPIHDFGLIDDQPFIDMRLVEGIGLPTLLAEHGSLAPPRAVNIVVQVASALDAVHAEGLVHRDVKPSNVLVAAITGKGDHAYLIDFGIAYVTAATKLTSTGMIIGTAGYMAPERFRNGNWDHRVDVYSLACLLYELLTGHSPPTDLSPPRPSAAQVGIPAGLDQVVAHGMAKDPNQRYPSAGALADAARAALSDTTPSSPRPAKTRKADQAVPTRPAAPMTAVPRKRPTRVSPENPKWTRRLPERGIIRRGAGVAVFVLVLVAACTKLFAGWFAANDLVTITVEGGPVGVAVSPDGDHIYVTNFFWFHSDTVLVIKTGSNRDVVAVPKVGENPVGVAVSPKGRAYVTNKDVGTVSVIDTRRKAVVKPISVGSSPAGVAVSPDGSRVYITNSGSSTVSVISAVDDTVANTITVGDSPEGVTVSRDGSRVYVANKKSNTVSVIDTSSDTVMYTVGVLESPEGVAVSPDGRRVYVTNSDSGETNNDSGLVSVIDTGKREVVKNITVGDDPGGVAVSPKGDRVYVANKDSDTVSVIDTSSDTVMNTVTVGGSPRGVAVSPDGKCVYVANYDSETVSVIETGLV